VGLSATPELKGAARARGARKPVADDAGDEHLASARAAGLRYVSDAMPGIRRRRAGTGFSYLDAAGHAIRDRALIRRFRSLVIPPAWTQVWICPLEDGHLQVTARDARGRKQYRYHPDFRAQRDATKFERLFEFGQVILPIREAVERDVQRPGLPRAKVLATVVWLLEKTLIRVGTQELARENKSYGLTTLKRRHVEVQGAEMRFEFRGKSRVEHALSVTDLRIARIVQRCLELRGELLFKYLGDDGVKQEVEAGHVNDYLREVTGADVTAKDFRTWAGTMDAAEFLRALPPARTRKERERNVVAAIDATAKRLGNTRAVCRKYYIHPALIDAYLGGEFLPPAPRRRAFVERRPGGALRRHEHDVLAFLKRRTRAGLRAAS
jgi:DNA topoisomerase-1